jgi:dTDP-4-dehydrorhamnose reductase
MTRILVTGASGLLGLNFCLHFHRQHELTGVVNSHPLPGARFPIIQADLSRQGEFARLVDQIEPELVLNCAALTNIDECESLPEQSWQINAELPGEMARVCASRGVQLVHLSTDAVFDGLRGDYSEEDEPNPRSVYARSKLAGEQAVLAEYPAALVARLNFYGWSLFGQRSLAEFFFYNLLERKPVQGFTDVKFCPLEVTRLAEILMRLVELSYTGLYHVVSGEHLTKYEFGLRVADLFGLDDSLIHPVSVSESGLRAARSRDLRLRTDKLAAALGHPAPGQAECLQRFYDQYQSGYPQQVRSLARPH